MATKTNWKAILAVYLIGVAAAAQVGRIAPAANSLREDMAMGLTAYGWIALPVMIVIFTLSFPSFAISANAAQR